MWSADDDTLLAAMGKGDQQAFNQLVQRHSPRLHAVIRRYTRSADDADEIVQDVFWQVWKSSSNWQPNKAKFSTWLYKVAVNRSIDELRKRKRRLDQTVDELPDIETDEATGEQRLDDSQMLDLMQKAIDQLPSKQRLAILLSTNEEKSNGEIADIMDTTEGAVEQLLVRARRTLREKYRELL